MFPYVNITQVPQDNYRKIAYFHLKLIPTCYLILNFEENKKREAHTRPGNPQNCSSQKDINVISLTI